MLGFTVWGALTLSGALLASSAFVHRAASREADRFVARVIVLGFIAKFLGSVAYYLLIARVYRTGDSFRYLSNGASIAARLRDGGGIPENAWATGTQSMDFIAGVAFALTQPGTVHGFVLFALLAYFGAYLALRGFTLAFPDGDRRRYAVLIMLTPTMVFWPSSISKDSWLVFTLGAGMYGIARIYRREPGGYWIGVAATAGMYLVRPHMAALFLVAAVIGFLIRVRDPAVRRGATAWLVGLVIFSAGAGYALATFDEFLPKDENVDGTTLDQVLSETDRRTRIGGSEFESRPVETPVDFLHALVTVPFRPFPHEVTNAQGVVASIEGLALLGLALLSFRRLLQLPRYVLRRPFVAMATAYSLGFIVAFANIGNFGILVRQRSQLLPLLAVLLCLPAVTKAVRRRRKPALVASSSAPGSPVESTSTGSASSPRALPDSDAVPSTRRQTVRAGGIEDPDVGP